MEQRSDVQYRAEKLYKNSREKFGYLIREIVSNSIHAVIIRMKLRPQDGYTPRVEFTVTRNESSIEIVVKDNGEGFNASNRQYFTHLDSRNVDKDRLRFHPKGQGRLAIVFFSDQATYSSIHIEESGALQKRSFDYPEKSASLFDVENFEGFPTEETEVGTTLKLLISKQQSLGRANTYFSKYPDIEKLKDWFIDHFFPFFMEDDSLELVIDLDGCRKTINRSFIERDVISIPFSVKLDDEELPARDFKVWLVSKMDNPKGRNQIVCFARHLRAELDGAKLEYEVDLPNAYDWFLTSDYLDDNVDQKGDKIEIDSQATERIQTTLNYALDIHFSSQISANRRETKRNVEAAQTKFHSLSVFIDSDKECETKCVLSESDIVNSAIEAKGRIERAYWTTQEVETEEIGRLLNSSLHIYIDHRSKILRRFQNLIRRFDEEGEQKNESEDEVHDLFLRRGTVLKDANNKGHLHNLWILDDKYTIFSETFRATSSKRGQEASDIYMWADDPERARELLILELKSTSVAHNAGNKYESMIAQVKRYAAQFYRDPTKILNWYIDPDRILYSGVVLARKSDIHKELNSNNSGAAPEKIPFLESSYYFNEKFAVGTVATAEPTFKKIRIEMYSYEDIYQLAVARNTVFFKLLKGEFRAGQESTQELTDTP